MRLLDFISRDAVGLDLKATSRDELLAAMVGLLGLAEPSDAEDLLVALNKREMLGSTGVGRGIAVPHCRTPLVSELRLAYGRVPDGLGWQAIDGGPVYHFFLIVAPYGGRSVDYLSLLGRLAQFAKEVDTPRALAGVATVDEFLGLLNAKGY